MNLDIDAWGEFKIADLFPVLQNGKANQGMLSDGGDCFYIGAKKDDNGVMLHCAYDEDLVQKGNCIVFICNGQGSVGYANYMDRPFIGTTDIVAGYNDKLNEYSGLFIATILRQERPKYSFGRKWKTHLKETIVKLPQTGDGLPDWEFMEEYVKSLNCRPISTKNGRLGLQALKAETWEPFKVNELFEVKYGINKELNTCIEAESWTEFRLGDLFSTIYKADAHVKADCECFDFAQENTIPFISRTESRNGCDCYVAKSGLLGIEKGQAIVIGDTTATCSYQADSFVCGDHIVICRADWINTYTALFIVTLIKKEQYKYSYGRAFKMQLIADTKIKLPIKDGKPDWEYMENCIKSLPYGDRI